MASDIYQQLTQNCAPLSNTEQLSGKCSIDECGHKLRSICKCCKEELCYQHLWQHNELLMSQLNLLKEDIHQINHKLQSISIQQSIFSVREQLKQWRIDCYTAIDTLCEKRCREFNEFLNLNVLKQRGNITNLQQRIEEFIQSEDGNQHDINFIKSNLHNLNGIMDKLKKSDFPITLRPLTVDEDLIQINY